MGSLGLVTISSKYPREQQSPELETLSTKLISLNGRHCFTTAVRFIFGHEELERQSCFVSQDSYGPLYLC